MKTALICGCLVALAGISGCGGSDSVDSPSTQEMSSQAKRQILDFVEAARKNAKTAPQSLTILMESLDAYVGYYGDDFTPVKEAAADLKASYDSSAPKEEVESKLQKLADAAETLASANS